MRAYAFLNDWAAVDRLLDPAAKRPLRESQDGLAFIRTKRHPTLENVGGMRSALEAHYKRTGCVDVSRLVYAAHVGLVEEAYRTAETACLSTRDRRRHDGTRRLPHGAVVLGWHARDSDLARRNERFRNSDMRSLTYAPDAARAVVKTSDGLIQEGASPSLEIALCAALPRFSRGKLSSYTSLSV